MNNYMAYVETLRTPKNGGTPYWDRKPMEGEFVYKNLPGDTVNRLKNVVRNISDTERIVVVFNKLPNEPVQHQISIDDAIASKSLRDAAESLCAVVNAVIELKDSNIIKAQVVNDKFKITYRIGEEQHTVVQPLE